MKENLENRQQENQEIQDAGAKTAHVAGKAAAIYLGGKLGNVAYDKISQTKFGQKIEQGAGKIISKVPRVNKMNKKLNDSGLVDAADKAIDSVGGKGGNLAGGAAKQGVKSAGLPNRTPGTKKVGQSSANTESAPKALKNNRKGNSFNNLLSRKKGILSKKDSGESEDTTSDDIVDDDYSEGEDTTNSTFGIGIFSLKMKIILIVAAGAFFLLIILVVLMTASSAGSTDTSLAPILSVNDKGNLEGNHYYDPEESSDLYEEEVNFNNNIVGSEDGSIPGIISEYQTKYGVTLNLYMLEATLMYKDYIYYVTRLDNMSDDEYDKLMETDPDFHEKIYDFSEASNYIETVADLMVSSSGDGDSLSYYSDVSKNGDYYNKLLTSSFLTTYYEKVLAYDEYSDPQKLVDEIFDYAEYMRYAIEGDQQSTSIISDTMQVHLQTCHTPYNYKTISGVKVFDNPAATDNEELAPSIVSLVDYGVGVLYGEISGYTKQYANGNGENLKEGLKALLVASYSFMLGSRSWSRAGLDLHTTDLYYPTGNCRIVSCNPTTNSHYKKYDGDTYGTCKSTTSSTANHPALSESQLTKLRELVSEVFGEVMVKKGVTGSTFSGSKDIIYGNFYDSINNSSCNTDCLGQEEAIQDSKNGMSYRDILAKYYNSNNYDILNIKEGLYVENADYSNASYDGNVIFYDQGDYKSVQFCGRSGSSISSSGCGVTSMAIIVSTFTGSKQYNPEYMMKLAYSYHDCGPGISGTNASFFQKAAKKFGYSYRYASRSQGNQVIEALKTGNSMVIAHMGPGHFTNNGHYIVLSAVNESGKVYVQDPNNRRNSSKKGTGNGWYNLNMIASELKSGFYIITKG